MIKTWMISGGTAVVIIIGTLYIMKYMIAECKKNVGAAFQKLDAHNEELVELNTKTKLAVTAKDVDDKFVTKELFRQMEKHIDQRFDTIQKDLEKILEKLDEK